MIVAKKMAGVSMNLLLCSIFLGSMGYGFVLLSAPGENVAGGVAASSIFRDIVFNVGHTWTYDLHTILILDDVAHHKNTSVGFQIDATVDISSVWQHVDDDHVKLLKIEMLAPSLNIMSRKAPTPEGFVPHSSQLEEMTNHPVYVLWNKGTIEKIFVDDRDSISIVNLKKGIASLFQFQLLDVNTNEIDASGYCNSIYTSLDPHSFTKTKTKCRGGDDFPHIFHPDHILSTLVKSQRHATYKLNTANNIIDSIVSEEFHQMQVTIKQEVGANVKSIQILTLNSDRNPSPSITFKASSLDQVIRQLGSSYNEDTLATRLENENCSVTSSCPTLTKLIQENKEYLKDNKIGTVRSANAFLKLITVARKAGQDEIVKILKHTRHKDSLLQLYDLMGFAQTSQVHEAVMKVLKLTDDNDLDYCERYFWALSMGSHPPLQVVSDVHRIAQKDLSNQKLQETILLALGSMANRFRSIPENKDHLHVVDSIRKTLESRLSTCDSDDCKLQYLRALKNLKHEATIPQLLEIIAKGNRKIYVTAIKALRSFDPVFWNDSVLNLCKKVFFQSVRPYDSTCRTIALDVILEKRPGEDVLRELVHFLLSSDKSYEVKQYLLQRLRMISDADGTFGETIREIITKETRINNYHVLGQRGLTTAFSRSFAANPSVNGSLVSIQEINGGILKQGIVDVVLESDGTSQQMFRLGLFAGGLNSFMSSPDDSNEVESNGENEEASTAGMEISVLGVQLRPFVFFTGQGELMGHVWSGTASEKTPAYQALILLHDHLEYIRLSSGMISELRLLGSTSFDLSGEVQLSIWNRNAHSVVEKNAGVVLNGLLRVDTSFVQSQVEMSLSAEPRLNLVSDLNFYSGVSLCMQLKQPNTIIKHNVYKVERIPGSKHRLRKSIYRTVQVPGKTYALNRKNNEMCNLIFANN